MMIELTVEVFTVILLTVTLVYLIYNIPEVVGGKE